MTEGKKKIKKKKAYRPRKFENASKVITFRVDEKEYENKKAEIRKEVDNTIRKVIGKKDKKHGSRLEKYYSSTLKEKIEKKAQPKQIIKQERELIRKDFNIDGNLGADPQTIKEIKSKVNEFITEQEILDRKESEKKKKIFDEFSEFIDTDLSEFMSR